MDILNTDLALTSQPHNYILTITAFIILIDRKTRIIVTHS